jgi:integrase
MRRKRSLVARRPGSPFWYENFTVHGRRFRGSLATDDKDTAEIIAAKNRSDALLGKLTDKKPEITLSQALGRYWMEHGQHFRSADNIKRAGRQLLAGIGKNTLLSEIAPSDMATYAARRRATLSNRSVNIELEHLRAVVRRASSLWGVAAPELPWKDLLLEEAGEREHVLSLEEETRLFAALRPDLHAMVRFALVSGARLGNVIGLTWQQIDWDARTITWKVKSKRPGGRQHVLPLTPAMIAIIARERGNHTVYVFTHKTQRAWFGTPQRKAHLRGAREPFTKDGWRRVWAKALEDAKITDFRFHDLRHTAATRKLRATGRLTGVQKMLGHQDIATTLRYARTALDDVREMMESEEATQSSHIAALEKTETETGTEG